jgi:hypothetical protein
MAKKKTTTTRKKKPTTRKKTAPKTSKASSAVLQQLNGALESFNDKSAMNFDGPGRWQDWVIDAVETRGTSHVVKLHAGKHRTTLEVPASVDLVDGARASIQFIAHVTDVLIDSFDNIDESDDADADDESPMREEPIVDYRALQARREEEQRQIAERIAQLEREEQEAQQPPAWADFEKAVKKDDARDFQSLFERADEALSARAVALLFSQKKSPDFVAEAIRPVLQRVKLTRAQWAHVAKARFASSVVISHATARA